MAPSSLGVAIVVPCYNEAARLRIAALSELARVAGCDVVAVDDGSTDATVARIPREPFVRVLEFAENRGQSAAMHAGIFAAAATTEKSPQP